ncbi:hypothetical protein GOZ90_24525 [Agrobacterium vitis]|uniref:Uncharacterized protein n=1 Tax=Agrobacterium vitis TaxID=373 RepID=A0A6L6VJS2_AGRVI|nr:hypothetical protein [Agrobacterium vitis]MUZ75836.1 hypothetical protein [Agrobacterium vitis]MVA22748.1 hypothetical protein [Agrobacterium vitis]
MTTKTLISFLSRWRRDVHADCKITIFYRPDISVRKYGDRGVLYGLQDCGHLIGNLQLGAFCYGIVCKTKFLPTFSDHPGPIDITRPVPLCQLSYEEKGIPSLHDQLDDEQTEILRAMAIRASVASFGPEPLDHSLVKGVINDANWLATKLICPADTQISFHLGERASSENWVFSHLNGGAGSWGYAADTKTLDLKSMFLSQSIVEAAQAILLLSTPNSSLSSLFRHSIAVGQLGQCLYIAAARRRVGVSCVGGFDFQDVASSFDLAQARHAAYVTVFGHTGSMRAKHDRIYQPTHRDVPTTFLAGKESDFDART